MADKDIKTKQGCRMAALVADPTLIKVRTIKRKYVEQLPTHGGISNMPFPADVKLEVVGATEAFVVCRRGENGNLLKCHRMSWAEHLCRDVRRVEGEENYGERVRAELDKAHAQIERYPQLFED